MSSKRRLSFVSPSAIRHLILWLTFSWSICLVLSPLCRHSTYRNLFFIGASTQPVIVAGSKVISNRIDLHLKAKETWLDNDDVGFNFKVLLALLSLVVGLASVLFRLLWEGVFLSGECIVPTLWICNGALERMVKRSDLSRWKMRSLIQSLMTWCWTWSRRTFIGKRNRWTDTSFPFAF